MPAAENSWFHIASDDSKAECSSATSWTFADGGGAWNELGSTPGIFSTAASSIGAAVAVAVAVAAGVAFGVSDEPHPAAKSPAASTQAIRIDRTMARAGVSGDHPRRVRSAHPGRGDTGARD